MFVLSRDWFLPGYLHDLAKLSVPYEMTAGVAGSNGLGSYAGIVSQSANTCVKRGES
jgi:hypothetical protein